jgi:hypothetical protein
MRSFNKLPITATFGDRFIEPAIEKSLQGFAAQHVPSTILEWLSGENNTEQAAWECGPCGPAQGGSPVRNVCSPNPSTSLFTPLPTHFKGGQCCDGCSPRGFTATPIGKNFQARMRREEDDESNDGVYESPEDDCSNSRPDAEDNESNDGAYDSPEDDCSNSSPDAEDDESNDGAYDSLEDNCSNSSPDAEDDESNKLEMDSARLALEKRPMWHLLHTTNAKRRTFAEGVASHPPWCKGAKYFFSGGYIDNDTKKNVTYAEDAADETWLLKCMVGSTAFNCRCKVATANGYKEGCYKQIWIAMKDQYPDDNTATRIIQERMLRHNNKAHFKKSLGSLLRRRIVSTDNAEDIAYHFPMDCSVLKVCENAFKFGHHIPKSSFSNARRSARKRHEDSAALPRNVDPLYGDRKKQVGGSPHYPGRGGKVMALIIKWAINVLPTLSQTVPVVKREWGLLRCGCTAAGMCVLTCTLHAGTWIGTNGNAPSWKEEKKGQLPAENQVNHCSFLGLHNRYKEFHKGSNTDPAHIGKDKWYFLSLVHRVRRSLGIAWVKTIGVTGDCSICLRIDLLQQKKDKSPEETIELSGLISRT